MTDAARPRRLHVVTWGCQMNAYDSARMADVLAPHGYAPAASAEEADMVILNTCHIRERASEKLFSELGRLRVLQQARAASGGRMVLAVAGCVAQAEGEEILARAPHVDLVLGPQTYHRLPEMLARVEREAGRDGGRDAGRVVETDFPTVEKFDRLPPPGPRGVSAFLTVQEGCDKFCSFCVVPYTRGAEVSRAADAILAEARQLIAGGAKELVLLGQNVNGWRQADGTRFGDLLRRVAALPGLLRLRYTTSHPRDVDDTLIAAHRDLPALMPFLHLPVQSGSDPVLRAMNRRHTADDYRRLVDRLRGARPDLALSSDFIVGHPGETDADFAATLALVRDVGFAQAYSFKYSRRPGTPAAAAPGQVAEDVKDARLQALQALLREQAAAFNRPMRGRRMALLVTGRGRHPGQLAGRSPWMQPVHLDGPATLIGREVAVTVTAAHPNSLTASLVDEPIALHPEPERACA